jgi:tetratricopeptide (TPR) repeat protein
MSPSTRKKLIVAIVPLMIAAVFLQSLLDPQLKQIRGAQRTPLVGLSNEFILGPLLGLQQAVAGLLWIRADEFFHEGDYDAILPIVRMVTWLDPHQLDVYITGAWHLSYNFTDSSERSDRRYIPAAIKLLEEGDANNPTVYDIAFEAGWQSIDKIKNYEQAEDWFRKASQRKAADEAGRVTQSPPMFVRHQLAHSLARQGRIDESLAVWKQCLMDSEERVKANPNDTSIRNVRDSQRHNYQLNLKRKFSRYSHEIDWAVDRARTQSVNEKTGEPSPRDAYLMTDPKEVASRTNAFRRAGEPVPPMGVGQPRPPATRPLWDTAFDTQKGGVTTVTFPSAKVLDIKGQMAVGDGARVTIRLQDEKWREPKLKDFTFSVDRSVTIMQDQHSVRNYSWGRKIDMSKDPKMYSFSSEHYFLILEFNPRQTSPFIQDRFGWSGEGITDKKYLITIPPMREGQPPLRMIRKVYRLSRAQIMGSQPVTEKDVVPNAEFDRFQQALQQTASR